MSGRPLDQFGASWTAEANQSSVQKPHSGGDHGDPGVPNGYLDSRRRSLRRPREAPRGSSCSPGRWSSLDSSRYPALASFMRAWHLLRVLGHGGTDGDRRHRFHHHFQTESFACLRRSLTRDRGRPPTSHATPDRVLPVPRPGQNEYRISMMLATTIALSRMYVVMASAPSPRRQGRQPPKPFSFPAASIVPRAAAPRPCRSRLAPHVAGRDDKTSTHPAGSSDLDVDDPANHRDSHQLHPRRDHQHDLPSRSSNKTLA